MNEDEAVVPNSIKEKVEEAIQFIPNISSLATGELELWINALQSGKDVQFNLTTSENGLLQISFVSPNDERQRVDTNHGENNESNKPVSDFVGITEEKLANRESSVLQICDSAISSQSIVGPPAGSNNSSGTTTISPKSNHKPTCLKATTTKERQISNDKNAVNVDDVSNSPIIVTVAIDDVNTAEENFCDKTPISSPADPDIFPCIRPAWYIKPPKSPNKTLIDDQCEINTTVLADDMRRYLRHNSIALTNFSQNYLQRSQGTLSDVLNHPKPWNGLSSRGKSIYLKMMQFLNAENLHEVVAELKKAYLSARPGPLASMLPASIMEPLQNNEMPSLALIEEIAATYELKTFQLHSYCEAQLRNEEDALEFVVELDNDPTDMKPPSDVDSPKQGNSASSNPIGKSSIKHKMSRTLRSGFQPRCNERQICPVPGCGHILGTKLSLEHHLTTHSGERPFKCDVCEKQFATISNLRCHQRRHMTQRRKVSKRALKAAMLREAYQVDQANKAIERMQPDSDLNHDIAKRPSKVKLKFPPVPYVYTCGVCFRRFPSKQSLQYHVTAYHVTARMKGNDKLHSCHICPKAFKTKASLFVHLRKHNGDRPFHCKVCKKRFYTKANCLRHSRTHTGVKPYRCPKCQAWFTEASSVATHMRIHTGEKPFVCETCGKSFSQSGSLTAHRLLHTGRRPYLCATCGLAFRQKTNLRAHERRHQGVRKHVCRVCSHASKSKNELQQHLLKHSNERPYMCNACPLGFTRLQYLKEHVHKVHDLAPHKCDRCGLGFPTKSALVLHQAMESESRLNPETVKLGKVEATENINETIASGAEYASSILQVLTDTICCLSPLSPANANSMGESSSRIPGVMADDADPSLSAPNSSSFTLNSNGNVPLAIVMERGLVFASGENIDPNLIEPGQVVSTDVSLEILPKIPLAGGERCSTVVADSSDPNMQSVIVAAEDCDQLESGARYVVVSVSDDATSLANSSFPMTSVTLERTSE